MRKYIGEIGLIIVAIIWGSGFTATAMTLKAYTPYQSMAVRFLIGAIFLAIIFHKQLKAIQRSTLIKGVILGVILYIAFALQTVGLSYTTPSKNAFLTAVNVIAVPIICYMLFKQRLDRFEVTGAFLTIVGIGLLSIDFSGAINIGDVLSLLCAFAFAFHIIFTGKFVETEKPVPLTIIQFSSAAIIGFVVLLLRGEMHFPIETTPLVSLIYLGVFSTGIAFFLQTYAQQFVSETKAAIILSTEAVWGMFFSIIIIQEIVTLKMALGAAIIIVAILITELKHRIFFQRRTALK